MKKTALKNDFIKMYAEIEFNATEDSLFERMALERLQEYADKHFGTCLHADILAECSELRDWLKNGQSEEDWRRKIRQKRVALLTQK